MDPHKISLCHDQGYHSWNIKGTCEVCGKKQDTIRYRCTACDWEGEESELINPGGALRDRYIEGDSCPVCWSETEEILD